MSVAARGTIRASGSGATTHRYHILTRSVEPKGDDGIDRLYRYRRHSVYPWTSIPTGEACGRGGQTRLRRLATITVEPLLHNVEFQMQSDSPGSTRSTSKLNSDPSTDAGAALEVWQNDSRVRRFDDTGPLGYWVKDKFCPLDSDGIECITYRPANPTLVPLDQKWRTTRALKINYFWPQNYNDASTSSSLLLDDLVLATQPIGCTVRKETRTLHEPLRRQAQLASL